MSRNGNERAGLPDPEVVPVAQKRQFTAEEKLRILEEADGCTESGEIGSLLRREGIYSSYLTRWRRARDKGLLDALGSKKRGPKAPAEAALTRKVNKLEQEKKQLQARLDQAEAIIEIQKKVSELLGLNAEGNED